PVRYPIMCFALITLGPRKSGLPDLRTIECRSRVNPGSVSRFASLHSPGTRDLVSRTSERTDLGFTEIGTSYAVSEDPGPPGPRTGWRTSLSPHRAGGGAQRIEARLLLVAERVVEFRQRGLHGANRGERGLQALLHGLDPA